MRVLVIGANGQIGQMVVSRLKEKGHEPVAMLRKEEQAQAFEDDGIDTVIADLEEDFSHAFEDVNGVIFTAGSGASTGGDKTILIDQEGAIEAIDLAKSHELDHFVMVSGLGVENPRGVEGEIRPYLHAKHRADEHLIDSGVPYTILRPGLLKNGEGKGTVTFYEYKGETKSGEIIREDVADVLVKIIGYPPEDKIYYVVKGETSISQIL
ncbi:SDR family oxidoreductase [Salinicoccus siamensis]|uniref:SDR family oxidoreductase n=1 Tax=Salinicoccus siamensis TaxID=381830 RepID=A0ABV5Z568_9STAP